MQGDLAGHNSKSAVHFGDLASAKSGFAVADGEPADDNSSLACAGGDFAVPNSGFAVVDGGLAFQKGGPAFSKSERSVGYGRATYAKNVFFCRLDHLAGQKTTVNPKEPFRPPPPPWRKFILMARIFAVTSRPRRFEPRTTRKGFHAKAQRREAEK